MNSILITGGTGAFGTAFTERLLRDGLATRIRIFSRDEWKHAQMRVKFGEDSRIRWCLGCVRDQPRLEEAMEGCDTVVHAAALKRIETAFYNPDEFFKTNLDGARNVVRAAKRCGVERVIGLSTDKAFKPVERSPYGISKAAMESVFLNANEFYGEHGPAFSITRYGNVWRSTGSVVPKWEMQIENGAEYVTVSDPEVTRFFMTMNEAVDLVLDTLKTMPKEAAVPILPAWRLGDLAEAMRVKTITTGLGRFEKLHEEMAEGNCSLTARRMSIEELREQIANV